MKTIEEIDSEIARLRAEVTELRRRDMKEAGEAQLHRLKLEESFEALGMTPDQARHAAVGRGKAVDEVDALAKWLGGNREAARIFIERNRRGGRSK